MQLNTVKWYMMSSPSLSYNFFFIQIITIANVVDLIMTTLKISEFYFLFKHKVYLLRRYYPTIGECHDG